MGHQWPFTSHMERRHTFPPHINVETFQETARLTLVPPGQVHNTLAALLTHVLEVSEEKYRNSLRKLVGQTAGWVHEPSNASFEKSPTPVTRDHSVMLARGTIPEWLPKIINYHPLRLNVEPCNVPTHFAQHTWPRVHDARWPTYSRCVWIILHFRSSVWGPGPFDFEYFRVCGCQLQYWDDIHLKLALYLMTNQVYVLKNLHTTYLDIITNFWFKFE